MWTETQSKPPATSRLSASISITHNMFAVVRLKVSAVTAVFTSVPGAASPVPGQGPARGRVVLGPLSAYGRDLAVELATLAKAEALATLGEQRAGVRLVEEWLREASA